MAAPEEAMRRIAVVLQEISDRLEREMSTLIAALDSSGGIVDASEHNLANVSAIRKQVADIAEREGLPKIVAALRAELPAVVNEALAASGLPLGDFEADITSGILAALEGQEEEVARAIVKGVSSEMSASIRGALTGAVDMLALQKRVAATLDTSLGRAAVALDRAVREVGDRALISAGKAASDVIPDDEFVFVYVGPVDAATRPYCRARAGKWLTEAQADALDPLERFRCRHVPAPALLSEVKANGTPQFKG